mmetsp:Transcript_2889/g.3312  ORF Transcript_2889/g.3312 Transcript_2889/m.3312 type:complete len:470 (+) Transcript_2889:196-1605(+)
MTKTMTLRSLATITYIAMYATLIPGVSSVQRGLSTFSIHHHHAAAFVSPPSKRMATRITRSVHLPTSFHWYFSNKVSSSSSSLVVPFMANVQNVGRINNSSFLESNVIEEMLHAENSVLLATESQILDVSSDIIDPTTLMDNVDLSIINDVKSLKAKLNTDTKSRLSHNFQNIQVVGHRGSLYHELENTRRGFQVASEIGCDAVELDVFLLKCGSLVVFHGGGDDASPGWLDEYCNIEGSILDYTADEAQSNLVFNPYFAEFGCGPEKIKNNDDAYIPLLEEVLLDAKESGLSVKIELKGPGTAQPVVELVDKLDMVDQCYFSSFDHERIALVRQMRPELKVDGRFKYKTGALFGNDVPYDFIDIAQRAGASEVHLKYDTCTKERVQSIHEAGMDSMAWFRGPIGMNEDVYTKYFDVGNEDSNMYRFVMASGVKSMCVNRPDVLLETLGRKVKSESDDIITDEVVEIMS